MHLLQLPHYRKRTRCACPPGCILFQTLLVLKSDHVRRDLRSTGCHGGNAAIARRAVHFTRDSGRVRWRGGDREEVGRLFVKVLPKRVHLIKIIKFIFGSWGCSPKKEPPGHRLNESSKQPRHASVPPELAALCKKRKAKARGYGGRGFAPAAFAGLDRTH